jgi:ABC-type transport system involved in cytochrome bd biosynthesis fused ATPase/permease subunit
MVATVVSTPLRLLLGFGVAVVLLGVAGWLIAATDWSGPAPEDDPSDEER